MVEIFLIFCSGSFAVGGIHLLVGIRILAVRVVASCDLESWRGSCVSD